MLDRHVSTQCVDYETSSCASWHTKSWVSAHFLSYEIMSMRKFKHMTPCLLHNFPQVQSKHLVCYIISLRCSRNKVPHHYLLTYERFSLWNFYLQDVSMCKLCHRRTHLYATCDIISYVLSRSAYFHANVSTTRRVRVPVRALKDGCVYFLTYEDMSVRNF